MTTSGISMRQVDTALGEILALMEELDGVAFVTDEGRKNPNHAEINRNLARLADLFDLAAALTRTQYWRVRGFNDPMETGQ